ncbi:MAG TPA: hypothetical protein VH741_02345, partial [Candidatus Limnocylindrales bacterium]
LSGAAVTRACRLSRPAAALMADLAAIGQLSARGVHRVLRVARTIADLEERDGVSENDLLAAAALRDTGATAPTMAPPTAAAAPAA